MQSFSFIKFNQYKLTIQGNSLESLMSRNFKGGFSASNMSAIDESIVGESINIHDSNEAISENISISKTGVNVSISKNNLPTQKKKTFLNHEQPFSQPQNQVIQEQEGDKENSIQFPKNTTEEKQAIFLGQKVWECVQEKFKEQGGTETTNPDVLFEFFKRQKKHVTNYYMPQFDPKKATGKKLTEEAIRSLMPSAQKRMLLKLEFQKILTYNSEDVYYTLACGAQIHRKNQQQIRKKAILNQQMKRPHSAQKNIKEMVERLYTTSKVKTGETDKPRELKEREKRKAFGIRLREAFVDQYRQNRDPPLESAEKMIEYWHDTYKRDQLGIQWDEQTLENTVRVFMAEQIMDLQSFLEKKLGYRQMSGKQLYRLYLKYQPIQGIEIGIKSIKEYIRCFNQLMAQQKRKEAQEMEKLEKYREEQKKLQELRRFGRPISATPITVLSRPKNGVDLGQLAQKYQQDPLLKTLLHEQKMKIVRRPFEYGIYNMEEQIKIKGRIKPNEIQPFDKTIFNVLDKTYGESAFARDYMEDRVNQLLGQDNLEKENQWKTLSPILQEAMLVKSYKATWFREALVKHASRCTGKDLKFQQDKEVVQQILKFLSNLDEEDRRQQLIRLESFINTSEQLHQKSEKIKQLSKKGSSYQVKQKKVFYSYLEEKACQYVDSRTKRREVNLRKFLNQIFEFAMKQHREFVVKQFHVVEGEKECPKLLKYEFYRLQKQINPLTRTRDLVAKCHAWIPSKGSADSFDNTTHNRYAKVYQKDKHIILAKEQQQQFKETLWSRKKDRIKEREVLLMTYSDAKQCVFHPQISRSSA